MFAGWSVSKLEEVSSAHADGAADGRRGLLAGCWSVCAHYERRAQAVGGGGCVAVDDGDMKRKRGVCSSPEGNNKLIL